MNTRTASTLPKSIQELLAYKPAARRTLKRIQWDETMLDPDGDHCFEAVYEEEIGGGQWKTSNKRTIERINRVMIRGWCPHEKYGRS